MVSGIDASADNGAHVTGRRSQARRLRRHFFFLAVSAARRASHTGHKADGNTAGGVPSPGCRNPGIVPWTSVPWTYSHSIMGRRARGGPDDLRWFWSMTVNGPMTRSDRVATPEEAMAQFR